MNVTRRITLAALAAGAALTLWGCGKSNEGAGDKTAAPAASSAPAAAAPAPANEPLKVAFVYVGPVGDAGWTYAHDAGRKEVEAKFGDKVKTTYVESVPEGADAERVLRDLATAGNGIIFATSFGFWQAALKVAKQFPDVKFEHATGYKRAANLATYNIRFYEAVTSRASSPARCRSRASSAMSARCRSPRSSWA